uniref:Putative secreted protein n=1 Tax=Anopheles triannulatus TaxID=58253 RepID=A0A2M4B280_9DIPT
MVFSAMRFLRSLLLIRLVFTSPDQDQDSARKRGPIEGMCIIKTKGDRISGSCLSLPHSIDYRRGAIQKDLHDLSRMTEHGIPESISIISGPRCVRHWECCPQTIHDRFRAHFKTIICYPKSTWLFPSPDQSPGWFCSHNHIHTRPHQNLSNDRAHAGWLVPNSKVPCDLRCHLALPSTTIVVVALIVTPRKRTHSMVIRWRRSGKQQGPSRSASYSKRPLYLRHHATA